MLTLSYLTKIYQSGENSVLALKNINLNFRQNEFVAILGPSGCGKTTMLNIIGGLDRYTNGDLKIDCVSTKSYSDKDWDTYRNNSIGFVFQSYNLIPHQSVLENVELSLTLAGISKKERTQKAKSALEKVGLGDQCNKKPNQLSGGQMQRVAIARALVNDPQIVLADEPTGALDSKTSVQVMELLKEVAKDRLVIMVTHNSELARQYATRTISLLDGQITKDTNPYLIIDQNQKLARPPKQSSMSFATAFKLSLKNLISKRTRTFMTSFAGSIGIIGIALVLAVANGFNIYITKLQKETLANYPLTIYSSIMDITSISPPDNNSNSDKENFPDITLSGITSSSQMNYDTLENANHKNIFSDDYLSYLNAMPTELYTSMNFDYGIKLNMFVKQGFSGAVSKISLPIYSMQEMMSNMDMSKLMQYAESYRALFGSINWAEILNNEKFMQENYDVLAGKFPTQYNQVLLVVDSYNQISKSVLTALGFTGEQIEQGFTVNDFLGKQLKLVLNDDFYSYTQSDTPYGTMTTLTLAEENAYGALYDSENAQTLTICGIVRVNAEVSNSIYSSGVIYTPQLMQEIMKLEANGELNNVITDSKIVVISNGQNSIIASSDDTESFDFGAYTLKTTDTFENLKKMLGLSGYPRSISFYAADFDSKTQLKDYLNAYNDEKAQEDKVLFSDTTSLITSSMGTVVDAISYVLITFAAISLVVSSIMIGIITYVSVVERTREIGVLRALGARKSNIRTVFISETFIIGLCAGLLGIGVSYLLTFVINAIVGGLFPALQNLAMLNPLHALTLVIISFVLTMISGLIPSNLAAKKDPVVALRTE